MAERDRLYLKSRYETGDVPTQQDYSDLIDSFLNFVDDGNIFTKSESLATEVWNATGTEIPAGKNLYVIQSPNSVINVGIADNTNAGKLAGSFNLEAIPNGSPGIIYYNGVVRNYDTQAWTTGDKLYFNSTGDFTTTKPSSGFDSSIGTVLIGALAAGAIGVDYTKFPGGESGEGGPAIENRYANLSTMYLQQVDQSDGGLQFVLDAAGDPELKPVLPGFAYYEYLGTTTGDLTDYRRNSQEQLNLIVLAATEEAYTTAKDTDLGLNTTHRSSDGSDHSKVTANETAIGLNTTHRGSDGKDHSDVVLNNTHRSSDGSDHSKVLANETAIGNKLDLITLIDQLVASNVLFSKNAGVSGKLLTFTATPTFTVDTSNIQEMPVTAALSSIEMSGAAAAGNYRILLKNAGAGPYSYPALGTSFGTATTNSASLSGESNVMNIIDVQVSVSTGPLTVVHSIETVTLP